MSRTVSYYDRHASEFARRTVAVDMWALHARFLAHVPSGGRILDAGCGSGRDAKAFKSLGYRVDAFDASPELARLAEAHLEQPVDVLRFDQLSAEHCYDAVWACASVLHEPLVQVPAALDRLWQALKPGGVMYLSFKYGEGERLEGERHFTDANEARMAHWATALPALHDFTCWVTQDQRATHHQAWLNALLQRQLPLPDRLSTGHAGHPFLPQLQQALARADEIDFAVSFIKVTGLRLLLPDLQDALQRPAKHDLGAVRLRVLTSDYLNITDPEALRLLALLQEQGAQVRVFEAGKNSFHMKAYLFARRLAGAGVQGAAFIGSSNISRMALTDGLEWNYRVDYPPDHGYLEARAQFEALFRHQQTVVLNHAWIDRYEARRVPPAQALAPGSDEVEVPPVPTAVQQAALDALLSSRREGYRSGLVVLATGLGKTWLAAFDSGQMGARRVLFVAHRDEILNQAAATFVRIRPRASVGLYSGKADDLQRDVLCASVQTLGRLRHLERFAPQHFDYIVIDEFHHAAAPTYRRVIGHFVPRFLLGLTATPDRTDQADILSLCDDNLVYQQNLFAGIQGGLLAPFHYYGIWDESVDYQEIPWRQGRFDPDSLANKLATLARARHALRLWRERAQQRTLAFCVSVRHADFMAEQFRREGVAAAAVYAGSALARGEALAQLADGRLQVVFSVDLFNEGVDLPTIDTVLMLRPTDSKILFLQQLGRGLRRAEGKERLVVLDFIGNHQGFLHKAQALAQLGPTCRELVAYARDVEAQRLPLPAGCYINYDLQLIDFMKSLDDGGGIEREYQALKQSLGRRPGLVEFYRAGASLAVLRKAYLGWFDFVQQQGDLSTPEAEVFVAHGRFLRELETTAMNTSFKMVLLEAFQECDGWANPPSLAALSERSWQVLQRRRPLLADVPAELLAQTGASLAWQRYWEKNPVGAWVGASSQQASQPYFCLQGGLFMPAFEVKALHREALAQLVQEVIDYRFSAYAFRATGSAGAAGHVLPFKRPESTAVVLPYFPNLRIACGHFRHATADAEEHRSLPAAYGRLDPARHFLARASGNSMNGGKNPIRDGDYLLLELLSAGNAGSITGSIMAVERQDASGDDQYLLRVVNKRRDGSYVLVANNPDYDDMEITPEMASELRTLARLKAVVNPRDLAVGQSFLREEIPPLFGQQFNPGNWNSGHVVLPDQKAHVLLVTLNKRGVAEAHRYHDHWVDEHTFHWQSQNATTPASKKGREIIRHEQDGVGVHLFVRDAKMAGNKAAPFVYHGNVRYLSHTGSAPMSVLFRLVTSG